MKKCPIIRRGLFLAALVVECILAGCLIQGIAASDSQVRRMLTDEELSHYAQYEIALPDVQGRAPRAEEVLANCTPQEEKTVGNTRYRPYTSDVLPEYLYNCDTLLEITEYTGQDLVYVSYESQDGERVLFALNSGGVRYKEVYAEKTDTYYFFDDANAYKDLHFRHSAPPHPLLVASASLLGIGLAYSVGLYVWRRRKGALDAGTV